MARDAKTIEKKKWSHSSLAKKIKAISLQNCETKRASDWEENMSLNHNTTLYRQGFLATNQGVTDPQGFAVTSFRNRVGDEIIARGIKFKFWLSNKADRPNVMYNIYLFSYPSQQTVSNSNFWRGTDGNGGTMNRMVDSPNPEKVTVLKQFKIFSGPSYYNGATTSPNGREHSYFREFYLKLNNRKIQYRDDNGTLPKKTDIGMAVVVYDAYGSLITDNVASMAFSQTFYFKDP